VTNKQPTQAMGDDGRPGAADGTNRPGVAPGGGGGGGGGPYSNPHTRKGRKSSFTGGQTSAAYHGSQQLGHEPVEGKANPNAVRSE
jgi:hypothetical protein